MTVNRTRVGPMTVPLPPYALIVPVLAGLGGAAFLAWGPAGDGQPLAIVLVSGADGGHPVGASAPLRTLTTLAA